MALPEREAAGGTTNNNFTQTGTTQGSSTGTTSSSSSQTGSRTATTKESFQTDNMSAAGRSALDQLLAQLLAGGTEEQRQNLEASLIEQQAQEGLRASFSTERAIELSEGLVQQSIERAMQAALPQLALSAEGAGSSGDALTALLTNQVSRSASVDAAALAAGQVTDFGSLQTQLSGTLTSLIGGRGQGVTDALLSALNVDKGSQTSGTKTTRTKEKTKSSAAKSTSSTGTKIGTSSTSRVQN